MSFRTFPPNPIFWRPAFSRIFPRPILGGRVIGDGPGLAITHRRRRFPHHCPQEGRAGEFYSRPGNDLTRRFPLIVETLARLRSRSCIIDGEAVACDDNGVASFDLVRHHRANGSIFLYAFDLIELNGDDLRRDPLEVRKATLASVLAKAEPGIRFNEHIEGDGPTVFAHACKMGLEGIVSKRAPLRQSSATPAQQSFRSRTRFSDACFAGRVMSGLRRFAPRPRTAAR
jgi:hypothetical protein